LTPEIASLKHSVTFETIADSLWTVINRNETMTKTIKSVSSDVLQRAGISPDELFDLNLIPGSRNSIYAACNRGDIQCFRMGRRIIIPTAPLRK
jgi:hypothetical protein